MDKQALAVMIPVLAVFFTGLVVLSRTVIGKAIARRISGDQQTGDDVHQHLVELETEMAAMRQELLEAQERLDFAERLLARPDDGVRVGPAGERR